MNFRDNCWQVRTAVCLPLLCLLAVAVAHADVRKVQPSAEDTDYSAAQVLLFATPHLENVTAESRLHYNVVQTGSMSDEISSQIILSITSIGEDGAKVIQPEFLSGSHERKFASVEDFQSNALLLYFLEWDAGKMYNNPEINRHRVHRQHLQRLIRGAFLTEARVETGAISENGIESRVRRVRMRPLASRSNHPKYTHMWNKEYVFVFADVPGMIYRITTEIPADRAGDPPKERTEITFSGIVPASAYKSKGSS